MRAVPASRQETQVGQVPAPYATVYPLSIPKETVATGATVGRSVSRRAVGRQPAGRADEMGHGAPFLPECATELAGAESVSHPPER